MQKVLLGVDLINFCVGSENMILHIQGCGLANPRQLTLDWGKEDSIDGVDYLFLEGSDDGGVLAKKILVIFEPLCCNFLIL